MAPPAVFRPLSRVASPFEAVDTPLRGPASQGTHEPLGGASAVTVQELDLRHVRQGIGVTSAAACDLLETDGRHRQARPGVRGCRLVRLAADAFVEAWDKWKAGADDVHEALAGMGELLGAVLRDFIAQDDASQASLDALSTRLIDRLG